VNNVVFDITANAITVQLTIVGNDPETGLEGEMYQTTCMVDIFDAVIP
jgi:hypothetical protein